ncbi:hypothetical protein [Allobranchiibius sp. CTAmp26]|uniref:hypothetical protein n=1 Tax=Allobranchiibius sp. CTAmp26 TaxID=2815214 RepID=UPI001AA0D5D2|nr:hypothetical protein [Allobranchiibius sp. CTAmp26]MBO1756866.1 hypothetical protein [Allobranchiibius sp. CTAmp26]
MGMVEQDDKALQTLLAHVVRAAVVRDRAAQRYRQALVAGRVGGLSYARMAAATGQDRQTIREYVLRQRPDLALPDAGGLCGGDRS